MCDLLLKQQKEELDVLFEKLDTNKVESIVDLILERDRNIFFCGVGKSENIGSHTADMLKSIGIRAFSISPTNSLHGDLGSVRKDDVIFLYSKSGNTKELLNTVKFFKSHGCYIYGVFCNEKAKLIQECNDYLIMPVGKEIDGHFDLVPTTSFLNYAVLCNLLTSRIIQRKELTLLKYGRNHPAGDIGRNSLLTVNDVMLQKDEIPCVNFMSSLRETMIRMSEKRIGFCVIVDDDGKFVGIMTDGDTRRILLNNMDLDTCIINVCNSNPKQIISDRNLSLNEYYKEYTQDFVPVIEDNIVIGLVYLNKI